MNQFFSQTLKTIDYFGQPVQITFANKKKFTTVLGGLISLVMYAVTVVLLVNAGNSLFNKSNPQTSMTNKYLIDTPIINLTNLSMIYAAYLISANFTVMNDPSIYTMEINQFMIQRDSTGAENVTYIPLDKLNCSEYYDYYKLRGFEKEYSTNTIGQATCFNITKPVLLLGGNFVGDYFSNIFWRVKKCENSTSNPVVCKPEHEIIRALQGSYFQFYYLDYNVDLNNYTNPFVQYFTRYYILLDPLAAKVVNAYFKTANLTSDAGLVFQDNVYANVIVFDYYREQIDTSQTHNQVIDFYVNSSNNYLEYSRIYKKFQDYAATIGGLLKVMMIGGWMVTIVFNNYKMYEIMFSNLFYFKKHTSDISRKPKLEEDFSRTKQIFHEFSKINLNNLDKEGRMTNPQNLVNTISQNNLSSNNQFSNNYIINPQTKNDPALVKDLALGKNRKDSPLEIEKEIQNYREKLKEKLDLGVASTIKMHCFPCCSGKQKRKRRMFNVAFDKLSKYLDYLEIVKTLQQFLRIKKVLFTKTQEKIFNFYNKPIISDKRIIKSQSSTNMNYQNDYLNLYKYFSKGKEKENDSKIYKRLLRIMDEDIKGIFNKIYHDS